MSDNEKKDAPTEAISVVTRKRADGLHMAFTRSHGEHDKADAMAEAEASLDEDDASYAGADTPEALADKQSREASGKTSLGYSRRYANNYDAIFGKNPLDTKPLMQPQGCLCGLALPWDLITQAEEEKRPFDAYNCSCGRRWITARDGTLSADITDEMNEKK